MPAEKTQAPIHLEVRQVALAAKKAFEEGRLSAQGPTPGCLYRDDSGRPCAVGAALTDEQADRLGFHSIGSATAAGRCSTDDVDALVCIQLDHDAWATENRSDIRAVARQEAAFLATLNSILGEA